MEQECESKDKVSILKIGEMKYEKKNCDGNNDVCTDSFVLAGDDGGKNRQEYN